MIFVVFCFLSVHDFVIKAVGAQRFLMSTALELAVGHKLTTLQEAFITEVAEGTDTTAAIIKAGYNSSQPHVMAWSLLQQPQILAALHIQIAKRLAIGASVSRALLERCVRDEKVDMRLRVACAKDLLNRAGHIAPKATAPGRAGETPLNEMSMIELRSLADKLEGEIAGRAKEVSSAKAAPKATQAIDDII